MIAIINTGFLEGTVCNYDLRINKMKIASFQHDRKDGLGECLRKAAAAADAAERQTLIDLFLYAEEKDQQSNSSTET